MFRRILSIFRRVDDVQQQVDELTGMIDSVSGESDQDFCQKSYGLSHRQCVRLGVMILKMQDNCLSRRGTTRFCRWIESNNGAALYHLHFQELTLMLYAYFQPNSKSCQCLSDLFGIKPTADLPEEYV